MAKKPKAPALAGKSPSGYSEKGMRQRLEVIEFGRRGRAGHAPWTAAQKDAALAAAWGERTNAGIEAAVQKVIGW